MGAHGTRPVGDGRRLDPIDGDPVAAVRYLDVLALPGGGHRLFYEAPNADESHELRTAARGLELLDLEQATSSPAGRSAGRR